MDKHLSKLLPVLVVLTITSAGAFFVANNLNKQSPVASQAAPPNLPILAAEPQATTQISPDGKEALTMKKETSGDSTTYSFTTQKGFLFTKTVSKGVTFSIPFNTWSPDNKYVFVKEDAGSTVNYWVYPGEINVTNFFVQKLPNFKLGDITGWASNTLLIVNTNNPDGSEGPSFWFELPSKSFIRLSNRFN